MANNWCKVEHKLADLNIDNTLWDIYRDVHGHLIDFCDELELTVYGVDAEELNVEIKEILKDRKKENG